MLEVRPLARTGKAQHVAVFKDDKLILAVVNPTSGKIARALLLAERQND